MNVIILHIYPKYYSSHKTKAHGDKIKFSKIHRNKKENFLWEHKSFIKRKQYYKKEKFFDKKEIQLFSKFQLLRIFF